jgi:tripartite-type tricarboxylate transporter receptor subunit TctC
METTMNKTRRLIMGQMGAAALGLVMSPVRASTAWPAQPIRMVVPFPAGAGPDVYARLYATELSKALKVNVWVDNRPGVSGILGTETVARSAPDGATILYGVNQLVTFNPHLFKKLSFDINTDLAPVSQLITGSYVIVANNEFPASSLPQLLERAKQAPRTINYASYGTGTASHLGVALIEDRAGVELFHVPYRQGALPDVIGGHVSLVIEPSPVAIPQIQAGKVKPIAVTGANRLPALPDVPTVAETLAGYELPGWHGVFVASKTPADIVTRLSTELQRITQLPDMVRRFQQDSAVAVGSSADRLREVIAREQKTWGDTIRARNIVLD